MEKPRYANSLNQISNLKELWEQHCYLHETSIEDILKDYGVQSIAEIRKIDEDVWLILRDRYMREVMNPKS